MHIEIGPCQPLAPRDTVIVGSDGLFDNLHLAEIIELGRSGKPINRMMALADLATQRMNSCVRNQPCKPDDLTIGMFTP